MIFDHFDLERFSFHLVNLTMILLSCLNRLWDLKIWDISLKAYVAQKKKTKHMVLCIRYTTNYLKLLRKQIS